jgi:hypothetical protein
VSSSDRLDTIQAPQQLRGARYRVARGLGRPLPHGIAARIVLHAADQRLGFIRLTFGPISST